VNPIPRHPSLYQFNTRVWLTELSRALGRAATLDDIPDAALDELAAAGFDWIWPLSVWQTGELGARLSRQWRHEYAEVLPDLTDDDIIGSGFAIAGYTVHAALGGDAALARLRERLHRRGLRLMLDFVPNHTAIDHPWVHEHPEYYVAGTATDLAGATLSFTRFWDTVRVLAQGRDPHFPGWSDTLQLDYGNAATQDAMAAELLRVAGRCDGVRCDMAMLLLPEVFARTWKREAAPFWPNAIRRVRERFPDFRLLAEVYWDLESTLLEQGFDYAYDKRFYDLLRDGDAAGLRAHLRARAAIGSQLAHFLENHDEQRAAVVFEQPVHEAAAVISYFSPGLRFFHQGQFEGRRARVPVQLARGPVEQQDEERQRFYSALLALLRHPVFREGQWSLLACAAAWPGNETWNNFIALWWSAATGERRLVAVNYALYAGQCYARLPPDVLDGRPLRFDDLLGPAEFERESANLGARGLYLDMPAWGYHVFEVRLA
jgi:hypothetical protein